MIRQATIRAGGPFLTRFIALLSVEVLAYNHASRTHTPSGTLPLSTALHFVSIRTRMPHLLLCVQANRSALQEALSRDGNRNMSSVYDLRIILNGDAASTDLVYALRKVVAGVRNIELTELTASEAATSSSPYRNSLPALPLEHTARDAEVSAVVTDLLQRGTRATLLVAGGGFGKSCMAAAVGHRLVAEGAVPGGALWVDMREAASIEEIEARLCNAARVLKVGTDYASVCRKQLLMMPCLACWFVTAHRNDGQATGSTSCTGMCACRATWARSRPS